MMTLYPFTAQYLPIYSHSTPVVFHILLHILPPFHSISLMYPAGTIPHTILQFTAKCMALQKKLKSHAVPFYSTQTPVYGQMYVPMSSVALAVAQLHVPAKKWAVLRIQVAEEAVVNILHQMVLQSTAKYMYLCCKRQLLLVVTVVLCCPSHLQSGLASGMRSFKGWMWVDELNWSRL